MKKKIVTMSLLTLFAFAGSICAVQAGPLGQKMMGDKRGCEECDGKGPNPYMGKVGQVLGLSEAQQTQIQTILEAERTKAEPLRKQLQDSREQMRKLAQAETFDEAAVRALAAKKAEVNVELMVSRARTQNLVQAVLTPEQRELANKIRPLMQERRDGEGKRHNPNRYSRNCNCPQVDDQSK